jgi:hypothetical protein
MSSCMRQYLLQNELNIHDFFHSNLISPEFFIKVCFQKFRNSHSVVYLWQPYNLILKPVSRQLNVQFIFVLFTPALRCMRLFRVRNPSVLIRLWVCKFIFVEPSDEINSLYVQITVVRNVSKLLQALRILWRILFRNWYERRWWESSMYENNILYSKLLTQTSTFSSPSWFPLQLHLVKPRHSSH